MTNSFSNVGSIIFGWVPFSAEKPACVFSKSFQANQRRQNGKSAADSSFYRFSKVFIHEKSIECVRINVERDLQVKNLRKVASEGFAVKSETTTSVMADAAMIRVTGIMPAMSAEWVAPGSFSLKTSR